MSNIDAGTVKIAAEQNAGGGQPLDGPAPQYGYASRFNDGISMLDLLRILVKGWWLVLLSIGIGGVAGVVVAYTKEPTYISKAVVAPIKKEAFGEGGGGLGALASLTGLKRGGADRSTNELIEIMRSRSFLGSFIAEHDLLPKLFSKRWDDKAKKWLYFSGPPPLSHQVSLWVKAVIGENFDAPHLEMELAEYARRRASSEPTLTEGILEFSKIVSYNVNFDSGFVSVSIRWRDAKQATEWVNDLVADLNQKMSRESLTASELDLQFLNRELLRTKVVEMEEMLYALIAKKIKEKMLASGEKGYVLRIIDPAIVETSRKSPSRVAIIGVSLLSGFVSSVLLLLLFRIIKVSRASSRNRATNETV